MSEVSDEKSIVLVGRPNVGKSRLFNRLIGRRVSIVHDQPGVTRDIVIEKLSDNILLMDTGGMGATADVTAKIIADATNEQAKFAIMAADTIVFVVDSQTGLTPLDKEIAKMLRESDKDVVLAINKVDLPQHASRSDEFYELGFKSVVDVSAEHGYGLENLVSALERSVGKITSPTPDDAADRIKICVAGRPNVGKSSIANRLIGEDKLIVSEIAGTTRDTVKFDIDAVSKNGDEMKFRLFDTAGLRTKRKINTSLDYLSSMRTRRSIGKCDVVFLVIDAMEGVSELDKRLAGEIIEIGASIIVVVNKWDFATAKFAKEPLRGYNDIKEFGKKFDEALRKEFYFLGDSPIFFVSALENKGIDRLLEGAYKMYLKMNSSVTTGKLNSCMSTLIEKNPPRYISGKRLKVYYSVKTSSRPYTIKMFCNSAKSFTNTYERYLLNGIRSNFNLGGVAIKLEAVGKTSQTIQERLQHKK